jgi:hypothetical protein
LSMKLEIKGGEIQCDEQIAGALSRYGFKYREGNKIRTRINGEYVYLFAVAAQALGIDKPNVAWSPRNGDWADCRRANLVDAPRTAREVEPEPQLEPVQEGPSRAALMAAVKRFQRDTDPRELSSNRSDGGKFERCTYVCRSFDQSPFSSAAVTRLARQK